MNNFDLLKERIEGYLANIPKNTATNVRFLLADLLDYAENLVENGNHDWISVDDELPKNHGQYLVSYKAVHQNEQHEKHEIDFCTANFDVHEQKWYAKDQLFYKERVVKVTHWQPLPTPPKE